MKDPGDDPIRRLFEEQRKRDGDTAPSFEEVLQGRPARRFSPWVKPGRLAAALVGLALLAVSLWVARSSGPAAPEADTLAAWRAPTDVLLVLPENGLLLEPRILEAAPWTPPPGDAGDSPKQKEAPDKP